MRGFAGWIKNGSDPAGGVDFAELGRKAAEVMSRYQPEDRLMVAMREIGDKIVEIRQQADLPPPLVAGLHQQMVAMTEAFSGMRDELDRLVDVVEGRGDGLTPPPAVEALQQLHEVRQKIAEELRNGLSALYETAVPAPSPVVVPEESPSVADRLRLRGLALDLALRACGADDPDRLTATAEAFVAWLSAGDA